VLFFLVAQVLVKVRFHQAPTAPILLGGSLIVAGGAVITLWKQ
jgi:small multidrug resistance family-3 protein